MRTSMKIASGVLAVVDPITAKYDAILATNPTVPVLFQLPEYRGQQVLFTDAAATDPVTEVGDPIGGVRHPVTGEIIAVQTTDANRPEWGGFQVGAVFDGVTNFLETFFGADFDASVAVSTGPVDIDGFAMFADGISSGLPANIFGREAPALVFAESDQDGRFNAFLPEDFVGDGVVGAIVSFDEVTVIRRDRDSVTSTPPDGGATLGPNSSPMFIGARKNLTRFSKTNFRWLMAFDRVISENTKNILWDNE